MAGGISLLSFLLLAVPAAGQANSVKPARGLTHLYNVRYCEFLLARQIAPTIQAEVFNTVGLGNCPLGPFDAADPAKIAVDNDAIIVQKSGPSRWVLDSITTRPVGDPIDMDGVRTRSIGTLTPSSPVPPAFVPIPIDRTIVWSYRKARTLRILISPGNRRYVMQSYSKMDGANQKEADLNRLGSNPGTGIPEGWTFKKKKVKQKLLTLSTRGAPYIVRDGFDNVYQRFNWPRKNKR